LHGPFVFVTGRIHTRFLASGAWMDPEQETNMAHDTLNRRTLIKGGFGAVLAAKFLGSSALASVEIGRASCRERVS
jgi:hypothetical protein